MNSYSTSALRAFTAAIVYGVVGVLPACADTVISQGTRPSAVAPQSPMKVAAPRKVNGSGIEVQFRIDGTPRVGAALTVSLGFEGVIPQAGASVRFAADAGLTLAESYKVASVFPEGVSVPTMTVQVVPTSDGLAYLHVFTTQRGVTSVSSIAIQVGTPAVAKPRGDLQSTPDGETIRTMPVR
ncbi:hypothetical protein ACSFA3_18325 [Variovorax sp. RHLX14]|uniref:hypothetical protein n=1 Tax=Variovorax sp. RHLX14 TaxID=1259731 RepID=UPI003F465BED